MCLPRGAFKQTYYCTSTKLSVVGTTILQMYTSMVTVARQLAGVHRMVNVDLLGNTVAVAVPATDPVRGAEVYGVDVIKKAT